MPWGLLDWHFGHSMFETSAMRLDKKDAVLQLNYF